MCIESESDLNLVLQAAFPNEEDRSKASEILNDYGKESFHREIPRVRAAIIKAANERLEDLEKYTEIACCDYRDILCIAEYPKQSKKWNMKKRNPEKYQKLVSEDLEQYSGWVKRMKST